MAVPGRPRETAAGDRTVVVLGAGINGAALARELALSGVGVVVVDGDDIACGATAWSTRLIHGGLRYLEYGEIGLVRESLQERNRLVRLAPHLVQPLDFYLPLRCRAGGLRAAAARLIGCESLARAWQGRAGRGSWAVGIGLTCYDLLAAGAGWPRHRMVLAGGAGLPAVDPQAFPRAAVYSDAQLLYPERFTVELLVDGRSIAAAAGARFDVCTHRRVRFDAGGMLEIGPSPGGGGAIEIRPDAIVNATGAWVDHTLDALFPGMAHGLGPRLVGGTKGSHVVLRCPRLREAVGRWGVYAEAADGRPIFVLPFGPALVLVGTTDIPFHGDPAEARADEEEIGYLLAAVARLFPDSAADRDDVQQHYCGVRPLPAAGTGSAPAGITRRHLVVRHPTAPLPAWSIVGGKLTTCRSLAEGAAAEVLGVLGLPVLGTSRDRPLPGNCGAARAEVVGRCAAMAMRAGIGEAEAGAFSRRLVDLFGRRAAQVWEQPAHDSAGRIRGIELPAGAVDLCVREEWAVTLVDVVERRLMLSFDERLTRQSLEDVAAALVRLGLLSPDRLAEELHACVSRLAGRYGRELPDGSRQ